MVGEILEGGLLPTLDPTFPLLEERLCYGTRPAASCKGPCGRGVKGRASPRWLLLLVHLFGAGTLTTYTGSEKGSVFFLSAQQRVPQTTTNLWNADALCQWNEHFPLDVSIVDIFISSPVSKSRILAREGVKTYSSLCSRRSLWDSGLSLFIRGTEALGSRHIILSSFREERCNNKPFFPFPRAYVYPGCWPREFLELHSGIRLEGW